jgi:hypothetical protein
MEDLHVVAKKRPVMDASQIFEACLSTALSIGNVFCLREDMSVWHDITDLLQISEHMSKAF